MKKMTRNTCMGVTTAALCVASLNGHGSLSSPPSRVYSAFLEGPETPQSDAVRAAIELGGTQPLYDWNELVAFHPGSPEFQRQVPYRETIPNGQLASAGNPKYAGFDQVRDDWPTTDIQSGPFQFSWFATTPHDPSVHRAFITTSDWDTSQPLNWDQMEELPLSPPVLEGNYYTFNTILPQRSGKHAIYVIWQRLDPVGEGFYAVADVDFGVGSPGPCAGDLDGDGFISGSDLSRLLAGWGSNSGQCECDLDGDGIVAGSDLSLLLGNWGLCGEDCNENGIADANDIADGATDCNVDGIPDECQPDNDCDGNGVHDTCEILADPGLDCDRNGELDGCQIAAGGDEDDDGVLDACELEGFTWSMVITNDWGTGFNVDLTIHNDSNQCLSGWNLEFDADFSIDTVWNGSFVGQENGRVRIVNEVWNGNVCHGESFTIGFQATGSPSEPTDMRLDDSVVNPAE